MECGQAFESSKQKLCGPEKKERLPREPKQKSKLFYQTKRKQPYPKAKPITDIYASVVKSKNGSEYCQVVFTVKNEFFPRKCH